MEICYTNKGLDDALMKLYGKRKSAKEESIPYDLIHDVEKVASKNFTNRQKECFSMYYTENKNLKQIADKLNLSIPTVCRHLQRARVKVYNELKYFSASKPTWN